MSDDRFARVHYDRISTDAKFDGMRLNRQLMGSWLLLLIEADKAWPSPALPMSTQYVPAREFREMVERGLIDVLPDGRYRMHGLDAIRSERSRRASEAANARWSADGNAGRNADALTPVMPSTSHHTRAYESTPDDSRADLDAFLSVRFRPPTPRQREFLDAYCAVFDVTGPERAADIIVRHPDDPIGALKADLEAFREQRRAEAEAQERPKPQPRRPAAGLTGVNAELAALLASREAAS